MTVFWIVAGLLVAGALLFVVPPLLRQPRDAADRGGRDSVALYRDQLADLDHDLQNGTLAAGQYQQARQDLERRLAEELEQKGEPASRSGHAAIAGAVIAGVPVLAIALYWGLGNPQGLDPAAVTASPSGPGHEITAEQIEAMVGKLAQRLQTEPGDAAGWSMLGRSYAALNRFPEASAAFARAVKLIPDDAQLLSDYADTLAMAQGRKLAGEPRRLIARALAADPNHFKALALAGSAAFEAGEYPRAVQYWERLTQTLPPDSEMAQSIAGSIAEARSRAGGTPLPQVAEKPVSNGTDSAIAIRGAVRLSPALAAKVAPGDTVFVFARAIDGPRVPLAVRRFRADQLPAEFLLDETTAMSPSLTLAQFKEVVVGARISKSGSPTPKPGDLEGLRQPVKVGTDQVDLVIDTVVQ